MPAENTIRNSKGPEAGPVSPIHNSATIHAMYSNKVAAVGRAVVKVVDTSIEDELLFDIIVHGYDIFGSDDFKRNSDRMLEKLALGLRSEARNKMERIAVQLVHTYRSCVFRLIRARLATDEDKNSGELEKLKLQIESQLTVKKFQGPPRLQWADKIGMESTPDNSDSENDSVHDFRDYPDPILTDFKHFLSSSVAYSDFKQQLADFVTASITAKASKSLDGSEELDQGATKTITSDTDRVCKLEFAKLGTMESEILMAPGSHVLIDSTQQSTQPSDLDVEVSDEAELHSLYQSNESAADLSGLPSTAVTPIVTASSDTGREYTFRGRKSSSLILEPVTLAPNTTTFPAQLMPENVQRIGSDLSSSHSSQSRHHEAC